MDCLLVPIRPGWSVADLLTEVRVRVPMSFVECVEELRLGRQSSNGRLGPLLHPLDQLEGLLRHGDTVQAVPTGAASQWVATPMATGERRAATDVPEERDPVRRVATDASEDDVVAHSSQLFATPCRRAASHRPPEEPSAVASWGRGAKRGLSVISAHGDESDAGSGVETPSPLRNHRREAKRQRAALLMPVKIESSEDDEGSRPGAGALPIGLGPQSSDFGRVPPTPASLDADCCMHRYRANASRSNSLRRLSRAAAAPFAARARGSATPDVGRTSARQEPTRSWWRSLAATIFPPSLACVHRAPPEGAGYSSF